MPWRVVIVNLTVWKSSIRLAKKVYQFVYAGFRNTKFMA